MPPACRHAAALLALGAALACAGAPAPSRDTAAARDGTQIADTPAAAGTTEPTIVERDGPVATLAAVRTAPRDGGVRVVFEFAGDALPGHAIAYEDAPAACGSGAPVPVTGDAHLVVSLRPARAHSDAGESTIAARTLTPTAGPLRDLTVSCDFEATLTWVLGLDRRREYRVTELASPARVVVEVGR